MTRFVLLAAVAFFGCVQPSLADQAGAGWAGSGREWILIEVDGDKPGYAASLSLVEAGKIAGQAPCNRYFGPLEQSGDSFVVGNLAATRMACPDLDAEGRYLQGLAGITTAAEIDGVLILTGGGHEMRFIQPID